MRNLVELNKENLQDINAGEKEWVLLGCLISPLTAAISIGFIWNITHNKINSEPYD